MPAITCPDDELLRSFLEGQLDGTSAEALEGHCSDCLRCQQACESLELALGLTALLARPVPPAREDPHLAGLLSRAAAIPIRTVLLPRASLGEVGPYTLLERIGAGGMGEVYRARHRHLQREVALKVLSAVRGTDRDFRERFAREMAANGRLTHPHIVTALDAGEDGGQAYLAMELVEGRDLATLVAREGPRPVRQAIDFVLQAARGLAHAHAAGVVHRDVKPANLLVDAWGQVKVSDLGLARVAPGAGEDQAAGLTGGVSVLGTPAFMAPEQAVAPATAGPPADVYALGCTLFALLAGRPPYEGQTRLEVVVAHRERPAPSIRAVRPDCPAAVEALFHRMVAKRPEDRCRLDEVITVLERALAGHRHPARRRAGLVTAAAVLILGVGAWALHWAFGRPGEGPAPPAAAAPGLTPSEGPGPAVLPRRPVIELVRVPAGTFVMGALARDWHALAHERPAHRVQISRAFWLGKYEITQEQYDQVTGQGPSAFSARGRYRSRVAGQDTRLHPVESISWADAVQFCNKLSERHGLPPYYAIGTAVTVRGGTGFRLPTEAEWEYACRAGSTTLWSCGDSSVSLSEHGWHAGNSEGQTHPVGKKRPNAWGLHDMHGNVPEWCWDRYAADYYLASPATDPAGAGQGEARVYRGGGWDRSAEQARASAREVLAPAYGTLTLVGLRVARDAPP